MAGRNVGLVRASRDYRALRACHARRGITARPDRLGIVKFNNLPVVRIRAEGPLNCIHIGPQRVGLPAIDVFRLNDSMAFLADVPLFVEHCEAVAAEIDVKQRWLGEQARRGRSVWSGALPGRHVMLEVACEPSVGGSL